MFLAVCFIGYTKTQFPNTLHLNDLFNIGDRRINFPIFPIDFVVPQLLDATCQTTIFFLKKRFPVSVHSNNAQNHVNLFMHLTSKPQLETIRKLIWL